MVILNACPQGVRRYNRSCLERGGGAFTSLSPGGGGGVIINACPHIFSCGALLSFIGVYENSPSTRKRLFLKIKDVEANSLHHKMEHSDNLHQQHQALHTSIHIT